MNLKMSSGAGWCFAVLASLALFAGCASAPKEEKFVDVPVSLGMSRADLRSYFGEPLRIEPVSTGGELWIYPTYSPPEKHHETTSTKSETATSLEVSKVVLSWTSGGHGEAAVIIGLDGTVIAPLPDGRIVRR